jgi:DNA-directed RNA polymerase specialized sigma24 family protein
MAPIRGEADREGRRSSELEAAITALPAQFRDTLVLRDIQRPDYREIAAVTPGPGWNRHVSRLRARVSA